MLCCAVNIVLRFIYMISIFYLPANYRCGLWCMPCYQYFVDFYEKLKFLGKIEKQMFCGQTGATSLLQNADVDNDRLLSNALVMYFFSWKAWRKQAKVLLIQI